MGKAFKEIPKKRDGLFNTTQWKQSMIDKMVNDDELVKLLYYNTPDCLSKPNLTEDERFGLVDSHIFGYRYVPEPVDEKGSFISMGVGNFVPQEGYRQFSDDYLMGFFTIYILVDNSIFRIDNGWRQDAILERVYNLFQKQRVLGIGEMRLESQLENWQHNNKFGGYTVGFRVVTMD